MRLTITVIGERRPRKEVLELLLVLMREVGRYFDGEVGLDRSGCSVNLVFFVPGKIFPVEFEGIQFGFLKKKEKLMRFDIAVPGKFGAGDEPAEFIVGAMEEVLREARARFEQAGIPCDAHPTVDVLLGEIRRILET